jgi:hypothetical protein
VRLMPFWHVFDMGCGTNPPSRQLSPNTPTYDQRREVIRCGSNPQ